MRRVNHETITGTLSLFKILPLDGSNPFLAKQKLHKRRKRFCEVSILSVQNKRAVVKTKSYLYGQFFGMWHFLWIIIMESSNFDTSSIWEEWCCWKSGTQNKEGTSAVLLQSRLDEKWWAYSMECYCYLRNVQDFLADGKTPYERRFGSHLKDQCFRLVQWLNIIRFLWETSQDSINVVR